MGYYEDELVKHPIHGTIEQLRDMVAGLTDEQRADMDEAEPADVHARAAELCDYLSGFLSAADAKLISRPALDGLDTAVASVRDQFNNIASTGPQYTDGAASAMDTVMTHMPPLLPAAPGSAAAVKGIGKRAGNAAAASVKDLAADVNEIRERLTAAQAQVKEDRAAIKTEDEQRIETLVTRADEIETSLTTEKTRLDDLVATHDKAFKEAEQARAEANKDAEEAAAEQRAASIRDIEQKGSAALAKVEARADEVLEEAEAKRERVEKLYGLITDKATSGAFSDEADSQKTEADTWRKYAIVLGTISAVIAIGAVVFAALDEGGSKSAHVGAVVVAVLLSGLAGYAAKQSGSHRAREVRARRLALELTAFGPFTDDMADPHQARGDYAERLFRGGEDVVPATSGDHHVTVAQSLLESIVDALKSRATK